MSDKPEEKDEPAENAPEEGEEKKEGEEKPAAPPPKPVKKTASPWMALAFFGFFLALAGGVGFVVWLLVNSFDLVKEDAQLSQARNSRRVVEKLKQEDSLGRGSELLIDKRIDKAARIRFLLRDEGRQPVTDAIVDIVMVRRGDSPTPPQRTRLQMLEPGVYRGEVTLDQGGLWEAQIMVQEGKNAYQVTKQIMLPEVEKPEPGKEPDKK